MSKKPFEWNDLEFFNSIYHNSTYVVRSEPYKIVSPFRMDSQKHKQKKRSSKYAGPTFLVEETEFVVKSSNILPDGDETDFTVDNNRVARCFVSESPECSPFQSDDLRSLGEYSIYNNETLKPNAKYEFCRYTNQQVEAMEVTINERKHLIPQQSKFILGEVSTVCQHLMNREELFDIIVVDPPWQNKSVRRKSVYHCGNEENWTDLDISELLAQKGFVCLWLTNGSACRRLADELIRKWSLVVCSEMFWLKITKSGRTVCDFRPSHKVPFEKVLFLCRSDDLDAFQLPNRFVVSAVPHVSHSRKPPVSEILRQYFGIDYTNGLELFARYLLPNFLSVGDQCLKFQDLYYYKSEVDEC
ncbi:Methyltransferase-like protein 4 [Aphelenchoides besseyi]|nr:Methyltransferase-like protein 4 [Aphelenchoides besseyi]